jgi:hypothetical protein
MILPRAASRRQVHITSPPLDAVTYGRRRRCPGTWWAPPPSTRLGRAIPVRRVRFPSTSATMFARLAPLCQTVTTPVATYSFTFGASA